jgi:NAD(P)-dependent dehydrogenase (short-subunit alcohol dehydrogenase family)
VSRREELEALVAGARRECGQIDILVCNAGINPFHGSSLDIPDSAFEKIMRSNVQSPHWLCQMVIPEMRERKDGAIILVASIGGIRGSTKLGAYGASKAALMQLTRNLATEFGPDNIRVNCVAPGLVKTDFARVLWENPELAATRVAETPLRRLGESVDCGGIAVYLASRAGAWTTGQTIAVDGGVTIAGN